VKPHHRDPVTAGPARRRQQPHFDDLRWPLADGRTPGRSTADPVVHQRQVRRP
jgi:hypothetical protein